MAQSVGTQNTAMPLGTMATGQHNKPSKLYTPTLIGDRLSCRAVLAFLISPGMFDPPIEQDGLSKHILHYLLVICSAVITLRA